MPGRTLNPVTKAALGGNVVNEAWLVRLDIVGDPVICWTGPRDVSFAGTSDGALNGLTFTAMGPLEGIGEIRDGRGGSQAVNLKLHGINLNDTALRQVVFNKNRWQGRSAWIWVVTLDDAYNIVGEPFRVKTGRMDKMNVGQGRKGNFVQCLIESYAAYASRALNTKYSEQKDIDATDISQNFVADLANRTAIIGGTVASNPTSSASTVNGSSGGGRYGNVNLQTY